MKMLNKRKFMAILAVLALMSQLGAQQATEQTVVAPTVEHEHKAQQGQPVGPLKTATHETAIQKNISPEIEGKGGKKVAGKKAARVRERR